MDSVVPRNNFTFPRNAYLKMRERNSLHTVLNGNRLIKQNKVIEPTKNNRRLKVFVSIKVYRKKIPPFIIMKPFRTFSIQIFMRKSIFFLLRTRPNVRDLPHYNLLFFSTKKRGLFMKFKIILNVIHVARLAMLTFLTDSLASI